jgi:hypothetical protein
METVDEAHMTRDRDTIERWLRAGGVDLDGEAERAKVTLRNMDRARK